MPAWHRVGLSRVATGKWEVRESIGRALGRSFFYARCHVHNQSTGGNQQPVEGNQERRTAQLRTHTTYASITTYHMHTATHKHIQRHAHTHTHIIYGHMDAHTHSQTCTQPDTNIYRGMHTRTRSLTHTHTHYSFLLSV